ncbi:hypothetical protein FACS1894153_4530 [Bacteroidia bacterium]|nr:hypothetical protein FACS1894153_4530 [Bacteroidia bacterium]
MERRFYRNSTNRVLGGVCSGLANYFNIDVVLVRIAFLLLFFFGGCGLLLYILLWILAPEKKNSIEEADFEDEKKNNFEEKLKDDAEHFGKKAEEWGENVSKKAEEWGEKYKNDKNRKGVLPAILFICIGVVLLLVMFNGYRVDWRHLWKLWPVIFIFIGISSLNLKRWFRMLLYIIVLIPSICYVLEKKYTSDNCCHTYNYEITTENSKNLFVEMKYDDSVGKVEITGGATNAKLDLSPYIVNELEVNVGAANIEVTLGDKADKTEVELNAGAANITLRIPKTSKCTIEKDTFLTDNNFEDFTKKDGVYTSNNTDNATKFIEVKINGAVTQFTVVRY